MSRNIALVLSSGGARGYAHIGAIKVLEQHGFIITSVAGTSMGALVGGMYAAGKLSEFENWVVSLDKKEVLRLTDFTISNKGLIRGKKVFDRIKQVVPVCNIEDLKIPYCAVATDIINGTERIFKQGDLYEAIRASVSIPTVLHPYLINDHLFVDGAILNPIPVNRVHRSHGDILVVVNVSASIPSERKNHVRSDNSDNWYSEQIKQLKDKLNQLIPARKNEYLGILNLTERSISTMMYRIADLILENQKPDILINISKESFGTYDLYRGKEIIEEGEEAARKAVEQYLSVTADSR
jgi:NTE family protein